jgi:HEAT repeat protein
VHAWNALKRITNREAVELLIMALKHENKFVRASAAEALGNTGSVQAQEALTKAIEDSSFRVRSAVKKALQKIKV